MKTKDLKNNTVEIDNPEEQKIVQFLQQKEKCVFGDFVKDLSMPYSDVLEHVITLKNKGIIVKETNGYYTLPKQNTG